MAAAAVIAAQQRAFAGAQDELIAGIIAAAPENRAVYVICDQAKTAWLASDEVGSLAGRIAEQAGLLAAESHPQRTGHQDGRDAVKRRLEGVNDLRGLAPFLDRIDVLDKYRVRVTAFGRQVEIGQVD